MRTWWHEAATLVAFYGLELSEVAKALGKSYESVRRIAKRPEFQLEVQRLRDVARVVEAEKATDSAVQRALAQVEPKALQTIATLAEGAMSENVRLAAARTVLEFRGHKPPDRVEATHRVVLSHEDAQSILEALAYARRRRGASPGDGAPIGD